VLRTPELLPVLKQAGVVDSGGKGLFLVFEGMHRAMTGQYVPARGGESPAVDERYEQMERKGHRTLPAIEWGFDVQFLIEQPNKPVHTIAADIAAMGDCPLVEGDEHLVKVHVHVFDPGIPISYGIATGFITDVVVENMDDMALAMRQRAEPVAEAEAAASPAIPMLDEATIGIVAVTPGPGFAEIFAHLGAQGLVQGGQSMNPSVAELAEAVANLPMRHVVVLPNNSNILMAAQQAAKIMAKDERGQTLHIVPTRTVPQGIAALTAYDPAAEDVDALVKAMTEHMNDVETGEVTQAVRSAEVDGIAVRQGDIIGLDNGKLVSCGSSVTDVSLDLLGQMNAADGALITIYFGDFVAEAAARDFAETVRGEYPEQDVELAFGGQPHYHYILSVE